MHIQGMHAFSFSVVHCMDITCVQGRERNLVIDRNSGASVVEWMRTSVAVWQEASRRISFPGYECMKVLHFDLCVCFLAFGFHFLNAYASSVSE